ncbi:MAG: hypothetical protein ABW278_11130 [Steroidobacteraceae bacterium]
MIGDTRAAQRLLLQGVMASTFQLVRQLRDGHSPGMLQGLLQERRRMFSELAREVDVPEDAGSLAALRAALAESDRTVAALIG